MVLRTTQEKEQEQVKKWLVMLIVLLFLGALILSLVGV